MRGRQVGGGRRRAKGILRPEEQRFLQVTIQNGTDANKKQALQRLCSLARQGLRSSSPAHMKAVVLYALGSGDSKVRRWAFNALALMAIDAIYPSWRPTGGKASTIQMSSKPV